MMETYKVVVGTSIMVTNDTFIVRASSVSDAERKVNKEIKGAYNSAVRVVKVEELSGTFLE